MFSPFCFIFIITDKVCKIEGIGEIFQDTHFPPHPKLFHLWDFLWPGVTDGPSICPHASALLQALTAWLGGEFHLLNQSEQFLQQIHFHLAASRLHPELPLLSRSGGAMAHDLLGEFSSSSTHNFAPGFEILDHGGFFAMRVAGIFSLCREQQGISLSQGWMMDKF